MYYDEEAEIGIVSFSHRRDRAYAFFQQSVSDFKKRDQNRFLNFAFELNMSVSILIAEFKFSVELTS